MSYGKRNSPESSKAGRKASRSQLNSTRLLSTEQVVGNEDYAFDDFDGYAGVVKTTKPRPRGRTQPERMGRETKVKQSRLFQDLELDDGYSGNKGKF